MEDLEFVERLPSKPAIRAHGKGDGMEELEYMMRSRPRVWMQISTHASTGASYAARHRKKNQLSPDFELAVRNLTLYGRYVGPPDEATQ